MEARDLFKLGFLTCLSDCGITPTQFMEALEKRAAGAGDAAAAAGIYATLRGALSDVGSAARAGTEFVGKGLDLAGSALPYALVAGAGIPALGGMATGWLHSHLSDVDEEDIKQQKIKQLIEQYRDEINQARAMQQRRRVMRRVR